jgi:hypothetical protein
MRKMYIISLVIIVTIIGLFVFTRYRIVGKELKISFVAEQKHTPQTLKYRWGLNYYEWMIITEEGQKKNLENEGYRRCGQK